MSHKKPASTIKSAFPSCSTSRFQSNIEVLQPREGNLHGLGCFPFARRYLGNRFYFLFLGVLRCFSSPRWLPYPMYSDKDDTILIVPGCPIQKSPDQRMFSSSPKLIAAFHVFHLHLTPRHPPFALSSLATIPQISLNTLMRTYLTSRNKSVSLNGRCFLNDDSFKSQLYFYQLPCGNCAIDIYNNKLSKNSERSRLLKFARFDPSKLASKN